jgi:hypothetical protein
MIMIGCDFHPGLQQIALLETETGRRKDLRLTHDGKGTQVRQFYAALPHPVRVGLESSGYSLWFEELLEELGHELWVGDPGRIRKQATSQGVAEALPSPAFASTLRSNKRQVKHSFAVRALHPRPEGQGFRRNYDKAESLHPGRSPGLG